MEQDIEKLKYPLGKFQKLREISQEDIDHWIKIIAEFPQRVKSQVENLSEIELNQQYRPNGWTIRQVAHHCADSHMNSFMRFKLALTENTPTIKPYAEDLWAELSDAQNYPINDSLLILAGLHGRWEQLLKNLTAMELEKEFIHPANNERISIKTNIGIYAWHCEHHLAHIMVAKEQRERFGASDIISE